MSTPRPVPQIDPAEADVLAAGGAVLLDVREADEWAAGHIPGAVHVPLGELAADSIAADRIPADRVVVAVCRSGNRSGKAALGLAAAGIDVRNLAGGMTAWARDGRAVIRDDGTPGQVA